MAKKEMYSYVDRVDMYQACIDATEYYRKIILDEIEKDSNYLNVKERYESKKKEPLKKFWNRNVNFKYKFSEYPDNFNNCSIDQAVEVLCYFIDIEDYKSISIPLKYDRWFEKLNTIDKFRETCERTNDKKVLVNVDTLNFFKRFLPEHQVGL